MTGTTMAAVRAAVVDLIDGDISIGDVPVSYGDPGNIGERQHIWLGATVEAEQEIRSMAATPTKRVEDYTFPLVIEVGGSYGSPRATEAQAVVLSAAIETLIAADPTLGGVTNLLWCIVAGIELDTSEGGDGARTTLEMTIAAKGRLG